MEHQYTLVFTNTNITVRMTGSFAFVRLYAVVAQYSWEQYGAMEQENLREHSIVPHIPSR